MSEEMYLLDNNALSHLTRLQRNSVFFFERCRLPSEILYEAEGYPDAEAFKRIEYPITAQVLTLLGKVMATVPDENTALIDLYANKGAADPLLIACALDGMLESDKLLFGPIWIIVSNDKAVRATASRVSVRSMTREEFLSQTKDSWRFSSTVGPWG
jgi:hypothetical protein